jgi:hypothetical protein
VDDLFLFVAFRYHCYSRKLHYLINYCTLRCMYIFVQFLAWEGARFNILTYPFSRDIYLVCVKKILNKKKGSDTYPC